MKYRLGFPDYEVEDTFMMRLLEHFCDIPQGTGEDTIENFQKAIAEGLDWEDPIEFLYNGKPEVGTVGFYPEEGNKMIRVYSPAFKPPKYMKYVPKTSFLRWIHDPYSRCRSLRVRLCHLWPCTDRQGDRLG